MQGYRRQNVKIHDYFIYIIQQINEKMTYNYLSYVLSILGTGIEQKLTWHSLQHTARSSAHVRESSNFIGRRCGTAFAWSLCKHGSAWAVKSYVNIILIYMAMYNNIAVVMWSFSATYIGLLVTDIKRIYIVSLMKALLLVNTMKCHVHVYYMLANKTGKQ